MADLCHRENLTELCLMNVCILRTSTPLPQDLDSVLSLAQALDKIEVLQETVWSLEREIDGKDTVIQTLRQILPECQQKERQLLEFRKTLGEEQISKAQRAVST